MLVRRLRRKGYDEVATAEDGRKALELPGVRSFTLVECLEAPGSDAGTDPKNRAPSAIDAGPGSRS